MVKTLRNNHKKGEEGDLVKRLEYISSLVQAHAFIQAVFRTIKEPLIVLDENYIVLLANRSFYQMFNVFEKDTVGKLIYKLGNNQWQIPQLKVLLEDILSKNSHFDNFEVEHTFPIIGHKVMLLNARKFYQDGQHILLAIEDVTAKQKMEKEKDEFASLVSHELKNPVTIIAGYIQLLEGYFKQMQDEKRLNFIDSMHEQVHIITNLINGLLNAGRIRSRGFTFKSNWFDIDTLIDKIINELQQGSETHKIIKKGKVNVEIYADKERIGEVLINLIMNAIKYSPNANKVIVNVTADKKQVTIGVQDFGVGITKKQQDKVFERFYQVNGKKSGTFYGVGLGLDITAQIIHYHGGKIRIKSKEGKGSTFFFTLPIKHK